MRLTISVPSVCILALHSPLCSHRQCVTSPALLLSCSLYIQCKRHLMILYLCYRRDLGWSRGEDYSDTEVYLRKLDVIKPQILHS